jgi:ElaA protein
MSARAAPEVRWRCCAFDALAVAELDAIYRARQQVFVIEQGCIYLDADDVDAQCWHLAAWPAAGSAAQAEPLAYASSAARGTGLGRELVRRAVVEAEALFPGAGIRISAQAHLQRFYGAFGFLAVGDEYMEDGIPHIEMLRPAATIR